MTSGPTREPIDPVRFIANHSSGKQGHAIAEALSRLGAETVLVSGPVTLPDPSGLSVVHIETARDMLKACEKALPVDVAVCAAAVADWRVKDAKDQKMKKKGGKPPSLALVENPDILKTLSTATGNRRPSLVVGFGAETEDLVKNATEKRKRKGCDWLLANDVSPESGTFGGDSNRLYLIHDGGVENWPKMSKADAATRLAQRVADHFRDLPFRGDRQGRMTVIKVEVKRLPHGAESAAPAIRHGGQCRARSPRGGRKATSRSCRASARWCRPASPSPCRRDSRRRCARARAWRLKNGVTVLNSPGTVDADYRGEVGVILANLGEAPFVVTRGMRIAQMVVAPVTRLTWHPVAELPGSARGEGGFGSTGTGTAKK